MYLYVCVYIYMYIHAYIKTSVCSLDHTGNNQHVFKLILNTFIAILKI